MTTTYGHVDLSQTQRDAAIRRLHEHAHVCYSRGDTLTGLRLEQEAYWLEKEKEGEQHDNDNGR